MKTKRRLQANANDPRCIDYRSGVLIGRAFDDHLNKTGETLPEVSKKVGIGVESLYAYQRGHQVPRPQSRIKLEQHMGLSEGALIPKPYRGDANGDADGITTSSVVEGEYLVITTRVPLSQCA